METSACYAGQPFFKIFCVARDPLDAILVSLCSRARLFSGSSTDAWTRLSFCNFGPLGADISILWGLFLCWGFHVQGAGVTYRMYQLPPRLCCMSPLKGVAQTPFQSDHWLIARKLLPKRVPFKGPIAVLKLLSI
eukprot:2386004-Amphidinium_carterae.1